MSSMYDDHGFSMALDIVVVIWGTSEGGGGRAQEGHSAAISIDLSFNTEAVNVG